MRLVRIGVAATSVKVGDFSGNASRLRAVIESARAKQVHLLVTPELGISGYSLEDRVWWPEISRRSWDALEEVAAECRGLTAFFGLPVRIGALMYNAMALVHDRSVRGLILKKHLPTYSIFYEGRNWTAWQRGVIEVNGVPAGDLVFRLPYGMVSAEICEDLWASRSPARERVIAGAEIICNSSASPFLPGKNRQRKRLVQGAASGLACVYAYANLLGLDNSRLVFDGGGIIATPEGVVAEGPLLSKSYWTLETAVIDLADVSRARSENSTWRQGALEQGNCSATMIVDVPGEYEPASVKDFVDTLPPSFFVSKPKPTVGASEYLDELFDGLVLGLRDYFEKVGAFKRFLVALSGGRDSALCLLLAVHAAKALKEGAEADLYADRVWAAYLPNAPYSSQHTENAARALAEELGVPFRVVSIAEETKVAREKAGELIGDPGLVLPLAKQNMQARIRAGMTLNWANSAQGLVLVTSNLSEAAVGYTTTGGDNQGGYSPIANLPKTVVTRLLEHIGARDAIKSLEAIFAMPPSAELDENQLDEADLMPYVVLDDLLYLFARRRMSLTDCWRVLVHRHANHNAELLREWTARFGRLFVHSQWKREQLPVALKVMELDLDPKTGFRFPVTQSIDDELEELRQAGMNP